MSEENVDADLTPRERELIDTVRHTLDATIRGDFDSAVERVDPDIVLVTVDGLTKLRGVDAFRAWLEPATIELISIELEHVEVAGSNLLIRQLNRGRGVSSGISHEMRFWAVWTFNEAGLLTRGVAFRDDEEVKARKAAGLSE